MLSLVKLYLERAESEMVLAETIFKISSDFNLKENLDLNKNESFYSAVISHCYYSIFYCAKAILLTKGIKTKVPNEHKKVFDAFKKIVDSGFVDKRLCEIYEEEVVKAGSLLDIFFNEKKKRGHFTYRKLPQANKPFAKESLDNALMFFKNINAVVRSQNE